jgi:hypothetical protein
VRANWFSGLVCRTGNQWRNFGLKSGGGGQKFWLAFWTLKVEGPSPTPKSGGTGPPVPPEITPMPVTKNMVKVKYTCLYFTYMGSRP